MSENKSFFKTSMTCSPEHIIQLTLNNRSEGTLVAGIASRSSATSANLEVQMDCISIQYTRGSTISCSYPALLFAWCLATASRAFFLTLSKSMENLNRSHYRYVYLQKKHSHLFSNSFSWPSFLRSHVLSLSRRPPRPPRHQHIPHPRAGCH